MKSSLSHEAKSKTSLKYDKHRYRRLGNARNVHRKASRDGCLERTTSLEHDQVRFRGAHIPVVLNYEELELW